MDQGQVIIETIDSRVPQGNALGDPTLSHVPVYLPPGYDGRQRRYPSVYVLSGFNGRGTMQLNDTPGDETPPQRLDRLIASGAVQPMVVVMPDCLTRLGGSQYINSSATGRYEDHLIGELVPFVDAKYRTVAHRNARAVAGKSSGGYGAVMLAMRHPQVFGLTASHSGDMYFELCYKPFFVDFARGIGKFGGLGAFCDKLHTIRPRDASYRSILNTIAMTACYSPNPHSPQGFDLPFDPASAELDEATWARWLECDPVHLVERHLDALKSLRLIYLDAGIDDEFNLQFGARIFCNKLRKFDVGFVHEEFNDSHMNIPYRYDHSFMAISEAIGTQS